MSEEVIRETLFHQHATQNTEINANTVKDMKLKWKYNTPDVVSHTPLVDETGVYFGDWGGMVYKVDLNSVKLIWKKKESRGTKKQLALAWLCRDGYPWRWKAF